MPGLHHVFLEAKAAATKNVATEDSDEEAEPLHILSHMERLGVRGLETKHVNNHLQYYRKLLRLYATMKAPPEVGGKGNCCLLR